MSLSICVCLFRFSFFSRFHLFLCSCLFSGSPSLFFVLSHKPLPTSRAQGLFQNCQAPSITPPCRPLLLAASSVPRLQWHHPGTSCHPWAVAMMHYDSVQVGRDDQPHQLCLQTTPPSYVLVFGEGISHAWRSTWSPCSVFVQIEPGP